MIAHEAVPNELAGQTIKEVFRQADQVAELHSCLTSPRGDYFRLRLLQALEVALTEGAIEELRVRSGVNEWHRHLHMLLRYGLIRMQQDDEPLYVRTPLAEQAINTVREFERRVGRAPAQTIYSASLGPNSIRLFLRIYGDRAARTWDQFHVKYTAEEMGRLSLFLPRIIEGISAVDKLSEADLVVYGDDGYVHVRATAARNFYQYLRDLYGIARTSRV